jgi:hypothetical protein
MKTFKTTDETLRRAADNIKLGNTQLAAAKKLVDTGKAAIADWLQRERDVNLDTLPIGELIAIDGICLIEIGKMNKFDEPAFQLAHPGQHAEFKRDFSVKKFKPI